MEFDSKSVNSLPFLPRMDKRRHIMIALRLRFMNSDSIHLERIAPGRAPGGIVVRICTLEHLLVERALLAELPTAAAAEADAAIAAAAFGEEVRAYFYDGDSGECMLTVVAR